MLRRYGRVTCEYRVTPDSDHASRLKTTCIQSHRYIQYSIASDWLCFDMRALWLPRISPSLPRLIHVQLYRRAFSVTARRHAKQVRIVEVGPRDGLQNEKPIIPLATKIELVRRLSHTGLKTIEAGSFVSPKWVPQMANSAEILVDILGQFSGHPVTYQWLLPNAKGLENFLSVYDSQETYQSSEDGSPIKDSPAANASSQNADVMPSNDIGADAMARPSSRHEISIFTAATESFSLKNTNRTISDTLSSFGPLIAQARSRALHVRAYISVALGCPYEGRDVSPHAVAHLATSLLELGADTISIADTTGMGTPSRTAELLKTLHAAGVRNEDLALHFHDTYGQALVNTLVALEQGITCFDSAVGGLGGCPFSPGATGNVSTEDLICCLEGLGVKTGVNMEEVAKVGDWISRELGKPNESRAGKATLAKL